MALSQLQNILGSEPKEWSATKRRIARDAVLYALLEPTKFRGWLEINLATAYRETKEAEERSDGANDFLKKYKEMKKRSISVEIQHAFGRLDTKPFEFPPKGGKRCIKKKKASVQTHETNDIDNKSFAASSKVDKDRVKEKKTREQEHVIRDIYTVAEVVKQIRRLIEHPVGTNRPSANKAKRLMMMEAAKQAARHRYSDHTRITNVWKRLGSVSHLAAAFAEIFPETDTDKISSESLAKLSEKIREFLCYANQFREILKQESKFGGVPIVESLLTVPDFRSKKYKLSPVDLPFTQEEKDLLGTGQRRKF